MMCGWLTLLLLCTLLPNTVLGGERRAPKDVPLNKLRHETQQQHAAPGFVDFVWWVPPEYWEATVVQQEVRTGIQREALVEVLRPVFMVVIAQADIALGALNFFTEAQTRKGLVMTYTRPHGVLMTLQPLDALSPALEALQQMFRPLLSAAAGNLGKNMWFFTYSDVDASGNRVVSPFEPGELQIALASRSGAIRSTFHVEFPLNALFVPRRCANGKPAHISWKYCPWDGTPLPE